MGHRRARIDRPGGSSGAPAVAGSFRGVVGVRPARLDLVLLGAGRVYLKEGAAQTAEPLLKALLDDKQLGSHARDALLRITGQRYSSDGSSRVNSSIVR